uniref:NAD(P)-binding protein n=1 Tax=Angiostrongylus cantonensis TaxID=6313 RepID=A0A0K0CYL0_ANGCA
LILIPGASSGIGKGTALRFAREGYALSLSGRDEKALSETAKLCKEAGAADVNNAGILTNGNVIDADLDLFDRQMNVNLRSVVQLTKLVLPHIIKSRGTVVNVSSIFTGITYYCMSKSALDQFTKCLALEMGPHGVRVNSKFRSFKFLEKGKSTHMLGRVGEVSEVAEAILFLASDKSSFTTGELLRVDGGKGLMHLL